jgi:hypothetical protein
MTVLGNPAAVANSGPMLSSEKVLHIKKSATV